MSHNPAGTHLCSHFLSVFIRRRYTEKQEPLALTSTCLIRVCLSEISLFPQQRRSMLSFHDCECCSALITFIKSHKSTSFSSSMYDLHKDALITVINASTCDPLKYTFTSQASHSSKISHDKSTQKTFEGMDLVYN